MKREEAEIKIKKLIQQLNGYNYDYYVLDKPHISDYQFDILLQELQDLENQFPDFILPHSPTHRVGGAITKHFTQAKHKEQMYSLNNTYSFEEIEKFDKRVKKSISQPVNYTCELKFDGVAISIIYENGVLSRAVTRGNGVEGDVVTANIKTIPTIPLEVHHPNCPKHFEVRGEVFLPTHRFHALNQKIVKENEEKILQAEKTTPLFANARNVASGSLKMQDSAMVAKRKLDCFIFNLFIYDAPQKIESNMEVYELLQTWSFKVSPHYQLCNSLEEIYDYIRYWENNKWNLPLTIDGIVIKVNNRSIQQNLGFTSKFPCWAIAFKYAAQQKSTKLLSIDYQVGRTGVVTPVANFMPVELGGTIVKRASLHNANEIERLSLYEGDDIFVEKGGEIIPKIIEVDKNKRKIEAKKITFITHCPSCDTQLKRSEGEAMYYCENSQFCAPQRLKQLEHFISKNAMNMAFMGKETLRQLYEKQLIRDITDIYCISKEDLRKLEGFKEKSITNLLQGIELSKQQPFENVLFAMGIRFVGVTIAKKLAYHFKNIDHLSQTTYEEYVVVNEIGEQIAHSLVKYFNNPQVIAFIEKLKKIGLKLSVEESIYQSNHLAGKTFVISGVFTRSRQKMEDIIVKNNGKLLTSVSQKLSYLVAGEKIGPKKREKAEKYNIPIISEYDLLQMVKK